MGTIEYYKNQLEKKSNQEDMNAFVYKRDLNEYITNYRNYKLLEGLSLPSNGYILNINYSENIFSELPFRLFDISNNKQMAVVLYCLREEFLTRIQNDHIEVLLPKFTYSFDEIEETHLIRMMSEWEKGNAMIYLAFESNQEDSSFGLILNDNEKKIYQSRSGNIFNKNINEIVHEILDFVFRVNQ